METIKKYFKNWAGFLPEEGDRIQSPKRCVLNKNQTMHNVQKYKNCKKILILYDPIKI
jgi:hypothetical protein